MMLASEELQSPLQSTPTVVICHATLEALALIQQEMLSFPCYPTLESEAPDLPVDDSRRAPWQCSEEDLHSIAAASRLVCKCQHSMRYDQTPQSSLFNPAIASTFRKQDFSTNQPSGITTSSSALKNLTTCRVNDRTESRRMIARALRSIMTRHPGAWRQSIKQISQRGESMGPIRRFLRLALQETGCSHAPPLRPTTAFMATSSRRDCSSKQHPSALFEDGTEQDDGLLTAVSQGEFVVSLDDKIQGSAVLGLHEASYTRSFLYKIMD